MNKKIEKSINNRRKKRILDYVRNSIVLWGLVGLITVYALLGLKNFFTINNLLVILQQSASLGIISFGLTYVIMQGGIDLSVGSIVGLGGMTAAYVLASTNNNSLLAFLACITLGIGVGLFNGIINVKGKVPSFIATLGMLSIGRGVCIIWAEGAAIPIDESTVLGKVGSLPYIIIAVIMAFIFAFTILKFMSFGRYVQAIGNNESASIFVGISVNKVKLLCFVISSLFAAIGGLVLTSRMGAGTPRAGELMELDAIAAVVLGGTPLTGGIGGVERTALGVVLLVVITNGLILLGVPTDVQLVVKGFVVIIAVSASLDRSIIDIIK